MRTTYIKYFFVKSRKRPAMGHFVATDTVLVAIIRKGSINNLI